MEHSKFTAKAAMQLAAPQTWTASVLPVLLAISCAASGGFGVSPLLSLVLLAISVLMQSSVNALNDYFDFVKGSDTLDDNLEASDAVLLHSRIRPKSVLAFSMALLALAFALGVYVIVVAGWIPLAIAGVGAVIVVLYSGGRTPISYLPIGELVSGFTMGVLISFACYYSLTLSLDPLMLVWAIPLMLLIGLTMMTNNTCDIEKDRRAGRNTLPALLGRERAVVLYRATVVAAFVAIMAIIAIWFAHGAIMLAPMLLLSWPIVSKLWKCPLDQSSRISAMSLVSALNSCLGCMYCVCILAGGLLAA